MSEDAGLEPRTVATMALPVRRSNHSARSHPQPIEVIPDFDAEIESTSI